MQTLHTRREWLWKTAAAVSGAYVASASLGRAAGAPTAPVAVSRCRTYDPAELVPAMRKMFDQLGGLGRLVKGKTVAIKINLTGSPTYRLGYLPLEDTHYTHPHAEDVRPIGRLGTAGQREDGRHQDQPDGLAHLPAGVSAAGGHALHPSPYDRSRRAPHGRGWRPPQPAAREPVVDRKP